MKAELRELLTIEHGYLDSVGPLDESFCVWLRAMIGPAGQPGEESFDFAVCSPAWLRQEVARESIVPGRFLLIADRFDREAVEAYVKKRISEATGQDWQTIAEQIARWSAWEFEDYRA